MYKYSKKLYFNEVIFVLFSQVHLFEMFSIYIYLLLFSLS